MACLVCGGQGGRQCPVCQADYCKQDYPKQVLATDGPATIRNGVCGWCGART